MSNIEGIIFDMDGCLYPLDRGSGKVFGESEFGKSIKAKEIFFVMDKLGIDEAESRLICEDLKNRHERHLSIGLEKEFGIPREEFFGFTWDLQAEDHVDKQPTLASAIGTIAVRKAVLSAAPQLWVERVLRHLDVRDQFGSAVFTGDADVRKPKLEAFTQVSDFLECDPKHMISIGDQEHTDIEPARELGMVTVRIGRGVETSADFLAPNVESALTQLRTEGFNV